MNVSNPRQPGQRATKLLSRNQLGVIGYAVPALAATFCVNLAMAQGASAPSSTAKAEETELEEVIITGIRASLEASIEIKRNADSIVEAVSTEDLGKFPDNNVVEALQRMTGVTISRNSRGEGQDVTIRGFGPAFNITTTNGRDLAGLSLSDMPAELISGAQVYKTSSAATQSGAIGGVINIDTPRPFDFEGRKIIATATETYEGLSGDYAPSLFGLYSNTFADNKWGVLLSVSQQQRNTRTDSGGVQSYLPHQTLSDTNDNGTPFDPSDDTVTPIVGAEDVFFPRQMTYEVSTSKIKRTGASGAVQFAPNSQLVLTLDGLYNDTKPDDNTYQLSHYFTPNNVTAATIGENNTVVALTTNSYGHTDFTRSINHARTKMQATGFNTAWKSPSEMLKLNLDLSTSVSKSNTKIGDSGFLVVGYRNIVDWEYTGNGAAAVTAVGIPGLGIPGGTFTDPSVVNAHFMQYGSGGKSKNTLNQAKFDGELNFGDRLLSKLSFGGLVSKGENKTSSNGNIDLFAYNGYWQPLDPSILSVFDAGSDFLGGDSNAPTAWLTFDPKTLLSYLRDISGNPNLLTPQPGAGFFGAQAGTSREKHSDIYFQADFAGKIASKPWKVNVGVRYVQTELASDSTTSSSLIDLLDVPGDPTLYQAVYDSNSGQPFKEKHTFTNWLPTLNARMNLTDEVVLRMAASQSLTSPNLADLSPNFSWTATRPNNLTASAGNPDLKPYLSTNFDVSGEWYYSRAGYVSLDLYSKRVDDYIVSGYATEYLPMGNSSGDFPGGLATVRVNRPRNLEVAKVKGIEVAVSHSLSYLPAPWDGFGFTANATFVKSPSTLAPGDSNTQRAFALEGVGDSQNLMVYYEKGPFGIRASYNHRNDYLQTTFNGAANEPLFAKGSGQLDIRASYAFSEHFSATLDGTNVTHTRQETYGRYKNQWISITDPGYRYSLGVRATF